MKEEKMVRKIEIYNLILTLCLISAGFAIWRDYKICLSIAIGSAIGGANFLALYFIVKGLIGGDKAKLRLGLFAVLKLAILAFVLFAAVKWAPINIVAFLVGLGTICMTLIFSYGLGNI